MRRVSYAVVTAVAALLGAAWGAVLPGLVDRYAVEWPAGAPKPAWRTACRHCGAPRPHWWRAGGRCPNCGRPPIFSRLLTVPLAALTCGGVAAAVGPEWTLPAYGWLAALAVPLALIDLRVLRLPDPLVLALFAGGLVLLGVAAVATGQYVTLPLRSGAAVLACGVGYLTLALIPRSQLGFGDVKLGAVLGLYLGWLGWAAVAAGAALAPVANLPLLIVLLITKRAGRRTAVPYGPAMLLAALVVVVLATAR
ncbi:prepilin peptidase [Micromonospora sp. NPDC000089]|uniref:prepilin peptidase n=1 Tax=unclassified Micromonospora TaxID=2617518 RepID=UPI0036856CE6